MGQREHAARAGTRGLAPPVAGVGEGVVSAGVGADVGADVGGMNKEGHTPLSLARIHQVLLCKDRTLGFPGQVSVRSVNRYHMRFLRCHS